MKAAWEWVKKYWEIVVGAIILVLGFFLGVAVMRRRDPVVAPLNPTKDEAEKEAAKKEQKAEQKAADERAEVVKEHEAAVEKAVEEIAEKTEAVRDDTDETNTYLKNVGKAVRGDDE